MDIPVTRLESQDNVDLAAHVKKGLEVIAGTLKLFTPDQIALTFNGGKDACVVLHLLRMELARQAGMVGDGGLKQFKVVYFEPQQEFPEITAFMRMMAER